MSLTRLYITILFTLSAFITRAQVDSLIPSVQQVSAKYLTQVDKKIDQYSSRLSSKTEKTLTKLSRWEEKIHTLLLKTSPETAARLFAPGQPTFSSLLQQLKKGEAVVQGYKSNYDSYRDKLITGIKYIATQKEALDSNYIKKAKAAVAKTTELDTDIANSEATEKFIKERKKQLIEQSIKYIGNSKYLQKINRESYYYVETLRNYKQLFNEPGKAEQTAKDILNKIPAFQKFMKQNSMLASLFGGSSSAAGSTASLAGLQTRAGVNNLIQTRIAAGGPNAAAQVRQQMQDAQAQLSQLKDKIMKAGGGNGDTELPDFKPNMTKTKTFAQRIVYNTDIQFAKSNSLVPTTMDISLGIGYRLNDKSVAGLAIAYKASLGTIQHIHIASSGIGFRSYIDWRLKKEFYVSAGYELSHNSSFDKFSELKGFQSWQPAGLAGLSKHLKTKSKYFKETKLSILYNFLSYQSVPVTSPWLFRVGYNF